MPDSLPPPSSWGIPSYDERDLDTLLSGEATEIPVALRPLADALTALKGPPTPAELRGEATIMAEFRTLAEFGAPGSASAQPGGHAETLELPAMRTSGRHRVRRPANRRFGAFLVAAAVAAIVGAVAFTGNLPGPIQRLSATTPHATSSTAVKPTSPNLQDRSAASVRAVPHHKKSVRPSPSPSPSVSAGKLCHIFFSYFEGPVNGQQWRNSQVYSRLSAEAGGSGHILIFCLPYLKDMFPQGVPTRFPGSSGFGQPGQQGAGNGNLGGSGGSDGNTMPGQNAPYPAQGGF